MDGGDPIIGREPVIAHLEGLRNNAHAEAELLGVAIATDNNAAITVDFTRMTGPEGNHACADKILFDGSGLIQEVWHCSTDSRA
jgi:hypothetical protein